MTDQYDIEELPELDTVIGVHGAAEQREIGGAVCIAIIVAGSGGVNG